MPQRMPSTSNLLAAALIAAASAFAFPPAQAASQQDMEACTRTSNESIDACTRIIEDESESAENRAAAHAARLSEYIFFGHANAVSDVHALIAEHRWSSARILEIMQGAMEELTVTYYFEGEEIVEPIWLGEAIGAYWGSLLHLLRMMELQEAPAAEVSVIQAEFDVAEELLSRESLTLDQIEDYLDRFW